MKDINNLIFDHHTHALTKGYFGLARRGGVNFKYRSLWGISSLRYFKRGPLPEVGVMQSSHLMVVCDMNFNKLLSM